KKRSNRNISLMAIKLILFFMYAYTSFSPYFAQAFDESSRDISRWCKSTPHPEPCKYYFMNHSPPHFKPRHRGDFRTMMVEVAMERAIHAQSCARHLGKHCQRNRRKKAAWRDCFKLFDNTVHQLNQTLQGLKTNSSSDFDAQTWLSAALTNLETCKSGSVDLNVTKFISPIVSVNVSELISNSLAVNGVLMKQQEYQDGYPSWVTAGARKLLQTSSLASRANAVVAKDGSGRFRTIQAAINYAAAAKRSRNARFIIHVKAGVYRENIEVGNNVNRIMLVGDGLRYTIITGSRSVAGGFTTYSSATVEDEFTNEDGEHLEEETLFPDENEFHASKAKEIEETKAEQEFKAFKASENDKLTNGEEPFEKIEESENTDSDDNAQYEEMEDESIDKDVRVHGGQNVNNSGMTFDVSLREENVVGSFPLYSLSNFEEESNDYFLMAKNDVIVPQEYAAKVDVLKTYFIENHPRELFFMTRKDNDFVESRTSYYPQLGVENLLSDTGVDGIGFMARGITFRNTAGPQGGQAVALRSASDLSVYYACSFEGYQDTLFVLAQRQFYKACYIYGTIDFIFGNAAVVFQNCVIYVRKPLLGQPNVITAQGRGDPYQNTGIAIHNSRILPAADLIPVISSYQTYLGRPWQQYSRTVILKTYLHSFLNPEGWLKWGNSNFALSTLYYGEYMNTGPAASTRNRVKWPGYHVIGSSTVASRFTVANLIAGRAWLPSTGPKDVDWALNLVRKNAVRLIPVKCEFEPKEVDRALNLVGKNAVRLIPGEFELGFLMICVSFPFFLSPAMSSNDVNWWCNQTPYPEPCKYFMNHGPRHFAPKQKSEFRKMAVQIAMERALNAEGHTKGLGPKCRNEKEKVAWADCLKLYEETILQLNHTADPNVKCSEFDEQTWLSTALTNLETCRAGFVELGVSDYMLPLMSNNVTKLISNTLAVCNDTTEKQTYKDGFPTWVTPGDRKLLQSSGARANLVVAQDGSGNYRTIKAALDAAAKRSGSGRFVIHVKAGVYRENLDIGNKMKNIMLTGDGLRSTIITGSRSVGGGSTTFNSATVAVTGEGFIARGITFRNTAGPQNHQAVALRSGSDLSVFYRCGFEGYQDTLYVHSQRQFYKECYIYGTVDFIFGNAAVVLQNCMIYARRPMAQQKCTITAQGRTDSNQNTGIVIHNSRVMASSDLRPVLSSFKTFLGRPWKQYSRTVYIQTYLDSLVDPAGWLEWDGNFALNTLYYGEYRNSGPGSSTGERVKWRGYRVITNPTEASRFSVSNFIAGRSWLPATSVPFTAGI
ncbi:hypothetical protein RJ640_022854, partial [Escallonia rubra]